MEDARVRPRRAYQGPALFDLTGDQPLGGGDIEVPFDQPCLDDLAAERSR